MAINSQDVIKALSAVKDPDLNRDVVSLGLVRDLEVGNNRVSFTIHFPTPASTIKQQLGATAKRAVQALGVADVQVRVTSGAGGPAGAMPGQAAGTTSAAGSKPNLIPQVKNTVAVASGKGGVGKSTVAANLAVALSLTGARVGLMDTDVYGPSVPLLMGGHEAPHVVEGKLEPPVEYGIKIISMAYFLPKDEAVIWRGPMLHKTINQFLGEVRWGELDYLLMDMPPGTGDIQLSLSQTIPLTGAVIVSTPQDLALSVASKAIAMFRKLNVPILGIVENMSYYICPECGHREGIFGHGGARAAAQQMGFPFLGEIPLDLFIRTSSDSGKPVALEDSTPQGRAFHEIARAVIEQVSAANAQAGQEISIE
jgi:ATP-binding protein involved in chromosome partitioning